MLRAPGICAAHLAVWQEAYKVDNVIAG